MKIFIENIRTFSGEHTVQLKPLTILTGENSSGKSTFLSIVSAVSGTSYPTQPRFNDPPYNMGAYDNIVSSRGAPYKRPEYFRIGIEENAKRSQPQTRSMATYIDKSGRVVLSKFEVILGGDEISIALSDETNSKNKTRFDIAITLKNDKSPLTLSIDRQIEREFVTNFDFYNLIIESFIGAESKREINRQDSFPSDKERQILNGMRFLTGERNRIRVQSIAPIRTRPKRPYDEGAEGYEPEGDHVPFVLSRILSGGDTAQKEILINALGRFGETSGLFRGFRVKRLGKGASDPYQLLVDVSGKPVSMLDVGYGVSQALPVLVQSILSSSNSLLLVQQPEVHLHPRAQAALGTFFTDLVSGSAKQFVIETHSDFIIDRIRQEVAAKKISHDLVQIIYFERHQGMSSTHTIGFDELGNLVNAPSTYRSFFLREELNLFNRGSFD